MKTIKIFLIITACISGLELQASPREQQLKFQIVEISASGRPHSLWTSLPLLEELCEIIGQENFENLLVFAKIQKLLSKSADYLWPEEIDKYINLGFQIQHPAWSLTRELKLLKRQLLVQADRDDEVDEAMYMCNIM